MRWMLEHLLHSRRDAKWGVRPPGPLFPRQPCPLQWHLRVPPRSREVPGSAEQGGGATNHPNQPVGLFFFYRHQMVLIEES